MSTRTEPAVIGRMIRSCGLEQWEGLVVDLDGSVLHRALRWSENGAKQSARHWLDRFLWDLKSTTERKQT